MELPDGNKIIGVILYNSELVEGDILWDNWAIKKMNPVEHKDVMGDIAGLANGKHEEALKRPYTEGEK